ncbi:hypothetical protein KXS07_02300 [Inquilinus limosus]|uniref:DUF6572 domain-containing protein n=1 Tax=Inquilinus limosus TaxID=171674 RepID=UPI003F14FEA3
MDLSEFEIKDGFSNDLAVPYPGDSVRFVINDTLPWTDEKAITDHLDIILNRTNSYLVIVKGDRFRKMCPKTSLDKVSIVLRLRHRPVPIAKSFLQEISDRLAGEGVRFRYGSGGSGFSYW